MTEIVSTTQEKNFDVKAEYAKFGERLIDKIRQAIANADHINIDPETREPKEYLESARQTGSLWSDLKDDEYVRLEFDNNPNLVMIEQLHDFPLLEFLAAREIVMRNENLSEAEVEAQFREDEEAFTWFSTGLEYDIAHETGHFLGAMEHTELKSLLGVQFFVENDGYLNFRPFIVFEGEVLYGIFKNCILCGPEELSACDQLLLGQSDGVQLTKHE